MTTVKKKNQKITSFNLMKPFCLVQIIILKVTTFLILLFSMQNILSIVAEKNHNKMEPYKRKLDLTLPDFLSDWVCYIIKLEKFLGCAPFVALCLLPFIVIPPPPPPFFFQD